jgi:hypothetical protein
MKWIAGLLLSSVLSAGAASAGTVTGVQGNAASVAVGAVLSVTVSGTNPCGAAHINYGDGTAITYAITGLPVTQSHAYDKPGTYAIVARGMRRRRAGRGYWIFVSEMSKTSAAFGGMGGLPAEPYAKDGGTIARRVPPTFMPVTAMSYPGITWLAPSTNGCNVPDWTDDPLWSAAVSL